MWGVKTNAMLLVSVVSMKCLTRESRRSFASGVLHFAKSTDSELPEPDRGSSPHRTQCNAPQKAPTTADGTHPHALTYRYRRAPGVLAQRFVGVHSILAHPADAAICSVCGIRHFTKKNTLAVSCLVWGQPAHFGKEISSSACFIPHRPASLVRGLGVNPTCRGAPSTGEAVSICSCWPARLAGVAAAHPRRVCSCSESWLGKSSRDRVGPVCACCDMRRSPLPSCNVISSKWGSVKMFYMAFSAFFWPGKLRPSPKQILLVMCAPA